MKKIILCLMLLFCVGLCFGQTESMSKFLDDYIVEELPFLKDYISNGISGLKNLEEKGFIMYPYYKLPK